MALPLLHMIGLAIGGALVLLGLIHFFLGRILAALIMTTGLGLAVGVPYLLYTNAPGLVPNPAVYAGIAIAILVFFFLLSRAARSASFLMGFVDIALGSFLITGILVGLNYGVNAWIVAGAAMTVVVALLGWWASKKLVRGG